MIKIAFIAADGTRSVIEAKLGASLMQAAIDGGINGIVAECGGSCQCATCHVYIESPWRERLPPVSAAEDAMLDNTMCERRPESRLSCGIPLAEALDGLEVHLPARQV